MGLALDLLKCRLGFEHGSPLQTWNANLFKFNFQLLRQCITERLFSLVSDKDQLVCCQK